MKYIKEILEAIYKTIREKEQEIIKHYDESNKYWYELFITLPGDEGTKTVETANTFKEIFDKIPEYIDEYRFDRLHIDVWKSPDKEITKVDLLTPEIAYNDIRRYYTANNIPFLEIGSCEDRFTENQTFHKGSTENGMIYKDQIAFDYFHDQECYIPDNLEEGEFGNYSYDDFREICKGDEKVIPLLFELIDWQHPSTLMADWMNNGLFDDFHNELPTYEVALTMIHNATINVRASSGEEAMNYVRENLDKLAPDNLFQFGEKTVDYAQQVIKQEK